MKRLIILYCLLALAANTTAQSAHTLLRKGDKQYNKEQYEKAEISYRKALDKAPNPKASYNLGNSIYQQGRAEEAVQHFEQAQNSLADQTEKANALFNLGNAHLSAQQVEEAIDAYKNALRLQPNDLDIKQNLYLAKLLRKEQEQQQQENKDQQEENQDQEQQNQEENQEENQDSEQQQSSPSEIENEESQGEPAGEPQDLSKEDALKLLQVIENEEKSVQEKLRKITSKKKKNKKDW